MVSVKTFAALLTLVLSLAANGVFAENEDPYTGFVGHPREDDALPVYPKHFKNDMLSTQTWISFGKNERSCALSPQDYTRYEPLGNCIKTGSTQKYVDAFVPPTRKVKCKYKLGCLQTDADVASQSLFTPMTSVQRVPEYSRMTNALMASGEAGPLLRWLRTLTASNFNHVLQRLCLGKIRTLFCSHGLATKGWSVG